MAEERISTPQGSAGIVRFYDVNASNIQLDPRWVLVVGIGFIVLEILLHVLKL